MCSRRGSLSQCNLGVLTSILGCFVRGFRFRILAEKLLSLFDFLSFLYFQVIEEGGKMAEDCLADECSFGEGRGIEFQRGCKILGDFRKTRRFFGD